MSEYDLKTAALFDRLGEAMKMVFCTAAGGTVSARMVSVIIINRAFYFQTDRTSRKYIQLTENPRSALCADNYQLEGVCEDVGGPLENGEFCGLYKKHYSGSYAAYTELKNERLIVFRPAFIKVWTYEDGKPFEEVYDIARGEYGKKAYIGE